MIILPSKYVKEVMSNEEMTFKSWLKKVVRRICLLCTRVLRFIQEFFTSYPGFQGFNPSVVNDVFISSVRYGLTHSLGRLHKIFEYRTNPNFRLQFFS